MEPSTNQQFSIVHADDNAITQHVNEKGLNPLVKMAQGILFHAETPPNAEHVQQIYKNLKLATEQKQKNYSSGLAWLKYKVIQLFGGGAINKAQKLMEDLESIFQPTKTGSHVGQPMCSTDNNRIRSMGIRQNENGTAAFSHHSTVPLLYYPAKYPNMEPIRQQLPGLPQSVKSMVGLNMDRGGVNTRQNGTQFGCLADGVGGGGVFSMFAAQAFVDEGMQMLGQDPILFTRPESNEEQGKKLFENLVQAEGPAKENSAGAATFIVASARKVADGYQVNGAALGDSVALHISMGTQMAAKQLNTVQRREGSKSDSGGQICAGDQVVNLEKTSSFSANVAAEDLIILASDGLIDNLQRIDLLPLILQNPLFDQPIKNKWMRKDFPGTDQLMQLLNGQQASNPTPVQAVTRLNNYVDWVIRHRRDLENTGISLQSDINNTTDPSILSRLKINADEVEDQLKKLCGKTDDVMIIAFYPVDKAQENKNTPKENRAVQSKLQELSEKYRKTR